MAEPSGWEAFAGSVVLPSAPAMVKRVVQVRAETFAGVGVTYEKQRVSTCITRDSVHVGFFGTCPASEEMSSSARCDCFASDCASRR